MKPDAPSRVANDNAAVNTEEEKITDMTVAAGEDPAPVKIMNGALNSYLFLPCQPIRDV